MTALYAEPTLDTRPPRVGLPPAARPYLAWTLACAGAAALLTALARPGHVSWPELAVLLVGGAVAQLFAVHTSSNQIFHTGLVFTVAAALVLPPEAFVLVCIAQHIPEWLRHRYPWFIQSFNIANCTLSGLAAWGVREAAAKRGIEAGVGTRGVAVAVCAAVVLVLVNHVLLARMLRLARDHALKSTGLFLFDSLVTDFVLGAIGIGLVIALRQEPAAVPVMVFPLVLMHRALAVPMLRVQALRDHKTGLLNSRGFAQPGHSELERARRFDRPLSLLVLDVDDLRGINNRHGHLAGDEVLVALTGVLAAELRDFDLSARFGGDEFIVLLPETPLEEAVAVGRRITRGAEECRLQTAGGTISFSVSIGVTARRAEDTTLNDLIARADSAMYEDKRGATAVTG